ncbi:MAG: DUF72 domain-containing protein [Actinomycetota bacterium]
MGKLFIGTSGYKYSDWEEEYYPGGLDERKLLNYYSRDFNTVEINFTYYSLPNPSIFQNMAKKVGHDFIFSVKAPGSVTHSRKYKQKDIEIFLDSLQLLSESGRLGCILMQFPWSFKYSSPNVDYLLNAGKLFSGYNTVVEFRNSSWVNRSCLKLLHENNISFCNVDEPQIKGLLPPTGISTARTGYIRFHGRNSSHWWNPEHSYQRYDYSYSREELSEWIPRIKKIAASTEQTFIYFNNHYKAKAVKSAKRLIGLLEDYQIITSQN